MLRFGSGGIPSSTVSKETVNGIKEMRRLGLDAMELEFVHSVNISKEKAPEVAKAAKDNDIWLSCHAPYYINLNAKEKPKLHASMSRIIKSAEILALCGGWSVAFHPGYYLKVDAEQTYQSVKIALQKIIEELKSKGIKIMLAPETTGKFNQFGNLEEVIRLSQDLEMVHPCIDFGHMHARGGKDNTYEEIVAILEKVEKELGKKEIQKMHIQFTGINYNETGERSHLAFEDSDYNYKALAKALKDFKVGGSAICESPALEKDALLLKKLYDKS